MSQIYIPVQNNLMAYQGLNTNFTWNEVLAPQVLGNRTTAANWI